MCTIKPADAGLGSGDSCGAPEERGRVKIHFQSDRGRRGVPAVRGAYCVCVGKGAGDEAC